MIVDDKRMIIGSANINDRSLRGNRDSEVAILLEGDQDVALKVNFGNKSYTFFVNEQILKIRLQLFKEHFGIEASEALFPITGAFWYRMWNIVKFNTQIYDIVFNVYPTNKYVNFDDFIASRKIKKNLKAFKDLKDRIQGTAVKYPWQFLLKEAIENLTKQTFGKRLLPKKALH